MARQERLPRLKVSENKRFLVTEDGEQPFFWLGDTAWELFHRLNKEQALEYLDTKAKQGYTVVQAVALAELSGLTDPNPYGKLPLIDRDPARPAVTPGGDYDYWDHVDFIIDEAAKRGIRIALLPTWGSWVQDENGRVFTVENARVYGEFIGKRYKDKPVIWVLGGDRRVENGTEAVWRAMAKGIAVGVTDGENYDRVLMTFHPRGGGTSSDPFHNDAWLSFNMHQTGHGRADQVKGWDRIKSDYERTPTKPVLDGEPLYEDHPISFRSIENGYSFDAHVRQRAYWHVFAGAHGHTYGDHAVWQMYAPGRRPVNGPLFYWNEAIHRPGAAQMQYLRRLIESRPMLSRVPDQSLIVDALDGSQRIQATRGTGYLFVYSGEGRPFTVNLGKISGGSLKAYWYSPRNGEAFPLEDVENRGTKEFTPPSVGFGSDWVLVLDDASRKFPEPGTQKHG